MKKTLRGAAAVIAGLFCGLLVFFPWSSLAGTSASMAMSAAAENGIFLTVASSGVSGLFSKSFIYNGVNADFPVFRFSAGEVTFTPSIISSLFSQTKSCRLEMGRGSLVPVTRQALEWNGGTADISLTPQSLMIENIAFTGKTSVTGFAELSRETGKLTRAKMLLKVPAELDRALEMAGKMGMVPLTKVKSGEWRIER
ncbi:type II secretion system protein GspN [Cloacibacillus porcorum]|uniref:type II secretion system protein GspN n=1 Tax=Cloacibacillus porcorum TaxID=1197717 RepID=UPI0023F33434|nr:type II secretion system protein GspN [Cloacibacillus porcorum]MDD7648590.1 hypothetical protein [Cloacibacillus porcorum]MDY4092980.1 type II secretion system protein GspN [Cloacibacillus porcorum]